MEEKQKTNQRMDHHEQSDGDYSTFIEDCVRAMGVTLPKEVTEEDLERVREILGRGEPFTKTLLESRGVEYDESLS